MPFQSINAAFKTSGDPPWTHRARCLIDTMIKDFKAALVRGKTISSRTACGGRECGALSTQMR